MAISDQPAERHRQVAGLFTERVLRTREWAAPTPVPGWAARDVVRHLTEWFPALLAAGTGTDLARGPAVDDDPVGAWNVHQHAVQALLDDPATASRMFSHLQVGELPVDRAVDQFYTTDVFMHTWDLARAAGQDDILDPTLSAELFAGMQPLDELLRTSGQYGPRVPVPADARAQDRLVGFIGRDPGWRP